MEQPFVAGAKFEELGQEMVGCRSTSNFDANRRRFVSFFGIEPCLAAVAWAPLRQHGAFDSLSARAAQPKHLSWGLLFLQCHEANERSAVKTLKIKIEQRKKIAAE